MPLLTRPLWPSRARGFTLVEMLVALSVMALLAVMSWRGLDAMLRARQVTADNHAALQSLQGGLAQWQIDLDALVETPYVNAVEWDGRVLRVLRRSPSVGAGMSVGTSGAESLQVVAWALGSAGNSGDASRGGLSDGSSNISSDGSSDVASDVASDGSGAGPSWLRWQSDPLQSRADLLGAWADAAAWGWAAEAGTQSVAVAPVQAWQLFYFRGGQWVAADSLLRSSGGGSGSGRPSVGDLPEGLRLQLDLPEGGPLQGPLRSDWFNPLAGAAR